MFFYFKYKFESIFKSLIIQLYYKMFPVSKEYINHRCGLHLDIYQQKNPENPEQLGIINGNGDFTKCSPHKHISREKYDEVVPKINVE